MAFSPDGKALAAAGSDGVVRLIDPETGSPIREFAPAPVEPAGVARRAAWPRPSTPKSEEPVETETLPEGGEARRPEGPSPRRSSSTNRFAYAQLLVTGRLDSGDLIDVTRMVEVKPLGGDRRGHAGRAWSGPSPTARRRSSLSLGGPEGRGPRGRRRASNDRAAGRLRPRRQPGPVPARLQPGDLPRLGPGQERVQALAPRLRPDLRRPGPDRRPGRPPGQRRLARRQPDAPEAHRRRPARRRPGDGPGRALLRDPPRLDRRRGDAQDRHAPRGQDRAVARPTRSSSRSA